MPEVIDTTAEVIDETTERPQPDEKLRPEDIPQEDMPAYTVASAIAWIQRPENDQLIRSWTASVKQSWKNMVQAIDRDVSKTGNLLIDMAVDPDVRRDFGDSLLRSIIGRGDDF